MIIGQPMREQTTGQQHKEQSQREREEMAAFVIAQRESVGWSQADLCRATGMNAGNLSNLENANRGTSGYMMMNIVKAVMQERERRLGDASFLHDKERQYNEQIANIVRDLDRSGLSQTKVDGVRESMNGIIKSVLAP